MGQLVFLVDEVKSRDQWKMGKIREVSGDESHVRTVEVWTGAANGKTFRRDVSKVVALEVE